MLASTRKRKDADVDEIKVQVCLFAFDLLYLNGRSYVKEPLKIRREALHKHFVTVEGLKFLLNNYYNHNHKIMNVHE